MRDRQGNWSSWAGSWGNPSRAAWQSDFPRSKARESLEATVHVPPHANLAPSKRCRGTLPSATVSSGGGGCWATSPTNSHSPSSWLETSWTSTRTTLEPTRSTTEVFEVSRFMHGIFAAGLDLPADLLAKQAPHCGATTPPVWRPMIVPLQIEQWQSKMTHSSTQSPKRWVPKGSVQLLWRNCYKDQGTDQWSQGYPWASKQSYGPIHLDTHFRKTIQIHIICTMYIYMCIYNIWYDIWLNDTCIQSTYSLPDQGAHEGEGRRFSQMQQLGSISCRVWACCGRHQHDMLCVMELALELESKHPAFAIVARNLCASLSIFTFQNLYIDHKPILQLDYSNFPSSKAICSARGNYPCDQPWKKRGLLFSSVLDLFSLSICGKHVANNRVLQIGVKVKYFLLDNFCLRFAEFRLPWTNCNQFNCAPRTHQTRCSLAALAQTAQHCLPSLGDEHLPGKTLAGTSQNISTPQSPRVSTPP